MTILQKTKEKGGWMSELIEKNKKREIKFRIWDSMLDKYFIIEPFYNNEIMPSQYTGYKDINAK